jgi:hypothetical protein
MTRLGPICGWVLLGMVLSAGLNPPERSTASAQSREGLTLDGTCNRGDVLVYSGTNRTQCIPAGRLELLQCREQDVVGTDTWGPLRCTSPSTTSSGARGLLPECSSGETLVSEGFGRWRCQSPSR